jgi:5-methylcytosine-specific restriction enzyme A
MGSQRIMSSVLVKKELHEDDDFQYEINDELEPSEDVEDKPKDRPETDKTDTTTSSWKRDAAIALRAIINSKFQCEIDRTHITFKSRVTGKPYLEAHHLVPISRQELFQSSIDVTANIVALCPNCHRSIHHAVVNEKKDLLKNLFEQRKERLDKCNIKVTFDDLYSYYV